MKRIFSLLLILIMIIFTFTGCVKDNKEGSHIGKPFKHYLAKIEYEIIGTNVCKIGESIEIKISMGFDEAFFLEKDYVKHRLVFYNEYAYNDNKGLFKVNGEQCIENYEKPVDVSTIVFKKTYDAKEDRSFLYNSFDEDGNPEFGYQESFMISIYDTEFRLERSNIVMGYFYIHCPVFFLNDYEMTQVEDSVSVGAEILTNGYRSGGLGLGVYLYYFYDDENITFVKTSTEYLNLLAEYQQMCK